MVFSSYLFLFAFLPTFLGVYYLLPKSWRSAWILVASYVFYGWWRPDFLGLLIAVTAGSYGCSLLMHKAVDQDKKRLWLWIGVIGNLGALAYFKYANFGIDSMNAALEAVGATPIAWTPILLPIGLSFFIFQSMSYLIDVYRGTSRPAKNLIDFAAFIALFAQLIAGPVIRYNVVAEQFGSRTHTVEKFSRGVSRFMSGFAKKVLLADSISPLVDASFALADPTMGDAWLGTIAYTLQLFFDFSGYSDMAIGLALMIGFHFPENFDHPYISASITEFWRRWHLSLSSWLRDYLYISLGGSRKGERRTYINLMATMVLGGMWHGANWTFILWGFWHGGILAYERKRGFRHNKNEKARTILRVGQTMVLVIIGWVIFRAANIGDALSMYAGLVGLNGVGVSDGLAWQVTGLQLWTIAIGIGFVYLAPHWTRLDADGVRTSKLRFAHSPWLITPLFVLAVLRLAAQSYSPFLYFQF
jgi:alginate O-acetyltransferase complex protein AlgI